MKRSAMTLGLLGLIVPSAIAAQSAAPIPSLASASVNAGQVDSARSIARGIMARSVMARRRDGTSVSVPNNVPGMSVAVIARGTIVFDEGFGLADIERQLPATSATRFRIGSLSKLLTAAALGRLVDSGAIQLDANVQQYVPEFPVKSWPVTVRQLASHLSGIRHYRIPGDPIGSQSFASLGAGLAIFAGDSLMFQPGARYLYSSYGYNLLGVALAGAAKEPFTRVVRRTVLNPLGMSSTFPDYRDSIVFQRATPYDYGRDQSVVNAPYDDVSYKWPSGGYVSTASDLARFAFAHISPGYLSAKTHAEMFASQRTSDGKETGVGLGWRIASDSTGRRYYHHGGAIVGGRGFILVWPKEQVVVVMLANIQAAFDERDARLFADLFMR